MLSDDVALFAETVTLMKYKKVLAAVATGKALCILTRSKYTQNQQSELVLGHCNLHN
jgi:hypothetical protein